MNVVVTGVRRGLGLEFAKQLASAGHAVVGTVRSRAPALDGTGVRTVRVDLMQPERFGEVADEVSALLPHIDLLIHSAGINSKSRPKGQKNVRFGSLEPNGLLDMVRVNAVAPVLLTQALREQLVSGSRVVCISSWLGSIAAKNSGGNYGYYGSKALLNAYMRAMAMDLKGNGVTTVSMNPGWVQTDMGGGKAPLTPRESVAGMLAVIEGLTLEDAGRFVQWDGAELAW